LILYRGLKRLDLENSVEWKGPRYIWLEQLFPLSPGARIHYGVPFGANAAQNPMPGAGPHARDEIQKEAWEKYRDIQDWISAGTSEWGFTVAADHQLVRLDQDLIRAEMIRGLRFTTAKIVHGEEVTSMNFPPPGRYVFKYSFSSGAGDRETARS